METCFCSPHPPLPLHQPGARFKKPSWVNMYPESAVDLLSRNNNSNLLYKHRWNTRWAFARKHDIFTRENNMLSSHVKRSPLLWYIINRVFCNDLVFHWCLYNKQNITWPLRDTKFLLSCWKIFHSFAALTREIFFYTRRKISYLRAVM